MFKINKFILLILIPLFLSHPLIAFENTDAQKSESNQTLIISCENSNSNSIRKIDVYGSLDSNGFKAFNLSTIITESHSEALIKRVYFGGKGTTGKLSSLFVDFAGEGSRLAIYDTNGILTLNNADESEIMFSKCINYL